jgi:hypothetical protein
MNECVNLPILEALRNHVRSMDNPPELTHIIELDLQGKWDEVWIPTIAQEGWVVITGDKGRGGNKKGEKLKSVCVTYGVTHILVSPTIQSKKVAQKIEIFTSAWTKIARASEEKPGTRFSLRFDDSGTVVLQKRTIKPIKQ